MSLDLREGVDFYYNETGNLVFTAKFLRDRGECCGNFCQHCPYTKPPQAGNTTLADEATATNFH